MPETVEITILSRRTRKVLYTHCVAGNVAGEARLRVAVEAAVKAGANLHGADLTGANLTCANLTRASLTGAQLIGAQLIGANLTGAKLTGADLTRADLTDADLAGANLIGADLYGAQLTGANLTRASLTGAHLTGAKLTGANLGTQRIIPGAVRSDGRQFFLSALHGPGWRIVACCRNFTLHEAREHWGPTYARDEQLAAESNAIIDGLVALAKARGWEVEA